MRARAAPGSERGSSGTGVVGTGDGGGDSQGASAADGLDRPVARPAPACVRCCRVRLRCRRACLDQRNPMRPHPISGSRGWGMGLGPPIGESVEAGGLSSSFAHRPAAGARPPGVFRRCRPWLRRLKSSPPRSCAPCGGSWPQGSPCCACRPEGEGGGRVGGWRGPGAAGGAPGVAHHQARAGPGPSTAVTPARVQLPSRPRRGGATRPQQRAPATNLAPQQQTPATSPSNKPQRRAPRAPGSGRAPAR